MAASLSAAIRPIPDVAPVMTTVLPRMNASRQNRARRDLRAFVPSHAIARSGPAALPHMAQV
jgi:hypothetical protein